MSLSHTQLYSLHKVEGNIVIGFGYHKLICNSHFENTKNNYSLIHSLNEWSFCSESSRHCPSQTVRARELKFWENVHTPRCVSSHVSRVTCHVSHVMCHMSQFCWGWGDKVVELVCGGSIINGASPSSFLLVPQEPLHQQRFNHEFYS